MKFNKKMLFGTIGSLLAGIFGIIAFFALKFTLKEPESSSSVGIDLTQINDTIKAAGDQASSALKAIYGLGVAGLVFAFVGMVFPLVSMFYSNEKLDKAFGILSVVFAVLALVLMVASVAVFAGEGMKAFMGKDAPVDGVKANIDAGYTAGQFIFVIVGGALAVAGNAVSYKEALAK